uniref:Reverse transcriptase domain-containing protein n=1 Tax=Echeneis naucrates TaxID=173247 RepID=A0A665VQ37_ECHNA
MQCLSFDTVDLEVLLTRLRNLVGMSGPVLAWFACLSGRRFSVSANQIMPDSADLLCGVPQGSVLGPILFLLYVLRLRKIIQELPFTYHLFADDIQLYCSFKAAESRKFNSLTSCLVQIKQWLSSNSLQLNSDKTEVLVIGPDDAIPGINQHLGDLSISSKSSLRNLGVIFDKEMSLEHHSKQLTRNCF